MYKILTHSLTGSPESILRIEDGAHIPFEEGNIDYQQYLIDTDGGLPIPEVGAE